MKDKIHHFDEPAKHTPTHNLDQVLFMWDPHDKNHLPGHKEAVFGELTLFQAKDDPTSELQIDYSDKLPDYDNEKYKSAWKKTIESGTTSQTGRFVQELLTNYYETPVKLHRIEVHLVNGWPVRSYSYEFTDNT